MSGLKILNQYFCSSLISIAVCSILLVNESIYSIYLILYLWNKHCYCGAIVHCSFFFILATFVKVKQMLYSRQSQIRHRKQKILISIKIYCYLFVSWTLWHRRMKLISELRDGARLQMTLEQDQNTLSFTAICFVLPSAQMNATPNGYQLITNISAALLGYRQ